MPHVSSVMIGAALFTKVIAAGAKMDARNNSAAPVARISVMLPTGMKSFPVELPE